MVKEPSKMSPETKTAPNMEKKETSQPKVSEKPDITVHETEGAKGRTLIDIQNVDFKYGDSQALFDISLQIPEKEVTAFIGPSGCGKSTLLRCLNRMNDLVDGAVVSAGTIKIDGVDINGPKVDTIELRKRVGMVFQKSNPFPKSIYENIVYGLRIQGETLLFRFTVF